MLPSPRSYATVLIVIAVAAACGRILSAQLLYEPDIHRRGGEPPSKGRAWPAERPNPMPTFGSNDRSRWATIRVLVDEGTFAIGKRDMRTLYATAALELAGESPLHALVLAEAGFHLRTRPENQSGVIFEDGWQSVDKVLDPNTQKYYSSKPPFLATLIAGLYRLLQLLTGGSGGWTLKDQPAEVVRTILLLVNAIPFAFYLRAMARIAERYAASEWTRLVIVGAAAFATMVTPFLVTLNNHLFATFAVLFALSSTLTIWERKVADEQAALPWLSFVWAGFFAAFAVCSELPALALWGALFGLLFIWSPAKTLLFFLPPGLLLGAAYLYTNHLATGELVPVQAQFGNPWYAYEGSHWMPPEAWEKPRSGIDWAYRRESRGEYALHLLVGHHGFFSLTPLWVLAIVGACLFFARRGITGPRGLSPRDGVGAEEAARDGSAAPTPWWLPPLAIVLTIVLVAFYLLKTNNYGGWTNGPRWLMWLSPLLLIALLPVVDRLSCCRWGRGLVYLCLGLSVLSTHYRAWNPWRHPWLYDLLVWLGWPGY